LAAQRNIPLWAAVLIFVSLLLALLLVVVIGWIPDRQALVSGQQKDRREAARAGVELLKALLTKLADVSNDKETATFLQATEFASYKDVAQLRKLEGYRLQGYQTGFFFQGSDPTFAWAVGEYPNVPLYPFWRR